MIPELPKAVTRTKGLTAAILTFLMLAAAITTAAASGTPELLSVSLPENSPRHPDRGRYFRAMFMTLISDWRTQ